MRINYMPCNENEFLHCKSTITNKIPATNFFGITKTKMRGEEKRSSENEEKFRP